MTHYLPPIDVSYVRELSASDIAIRKYSTLDLCAVGAFTLIINSTNLTQWAETISALRERYGGSGLRLDVCSLDADFDVTDGEKGRAWVVGAGLDDGGGLLVRPDQHILLPLKKGMEREEILDVMQKHLGR